jgi:hypothetical protein
MPVLGIVASQISGHLFTAGTFDSIATTTVGSGGASSITFSSIPATYTHLQIRGIFKPNTSCWLGLRFNSDSGSNYAYHDLRGNGTSASAEGVASQTIANLSLYNQSPVTSTFNAAVIDILDYANTSKYKTQRTLGGLDANGSGNIDFTSSLWMSTSAVTSIVLSCTASATFTEYSSFALYGIKGN